MLQNSAVNHAKQQKTPTRLGRVKSHRAHARGARLKAKEHEGTVHQPVAPQPSAGVGTGQRLDSLVVFLVLLVFILLGVIVKALGGGRNRRLRSQKNSLATVARQSQPALTRSTIGTGHVVEPRQPAFQRLAGIWMPPGCMVEICGYRINGGMVYVGSHLPQISGYGIDPALIDPALPIAEVQSGYRGEDMPYWPSYSAISPQARGLYLRWHAEGRQDQNVALGIVFLFFYGLERRLIAESSAVTTEERKLLVQELDRLLSIYSHNGSFWGYASQLRDAIKLQFISPDAIDQLVPEDGPEHRRGVSMPLRALLGRMADTDKALPAEWALRWVESDCGYYPHTPAQRCRDEFVRLFHIRYRKKYGDGYRLSKVNPRISSVYGPASASFLGRKVTITMELPDVTASEEPIGQFRTLADECSDQLDGYSQYLGRHPARKRCPEALARLPIELLGEQKDERVAAIIQWSNHILDGKEVATIDFKELESKWPEIHSSHYGKPDALALAQCLEKLGIGIEPDIRFGSFAPSVDGKLVFFKLPSDGASTPTAALETASMMTRLASMVAGADESGAPDKEAHLGAYLSSVLALTSGEQQRLHAQIHWLLVSRPSLSGIKKRLVGLDLDRRVAIGRFLIGVADVACHTSPAAVHALEKIYHLLGLEDKFLYSEFQNAATSPVTVQPATSGVVGFSIPAPPALGKLDGSHIKIDMAKVTAMRAETERVSGLLREIFVDEEDGPHKTAPVQDSILGLDHAQSEFLRCLVTRPSWSRADLEALAIEHQVLLDGAIDAINGATLDTLGEPLLEGESQVEVNSNALKELRL